MVSGSSTATAEVRTPVCDYMKRPCALCGLVLCGVQDYKALLVTYLLPGHSGKILANLAAAVNLYVMQIDVKTPMLCAVLFHTSKCCDCSAVCLQAIS